MDEQIFTFDFGASESTRANTQTPSGSTININDSKSAATVEAKRSARGTKRSAKNIAGNEGVLSPADEAALEQLFQPSQWRGIVAGPGQALHVLTGWEKWELEKDEIDTLAVGAANTARFFMAVHPKWVALSLFSVALLQSYGSRTAAYFMHKRSMEATRPVPKESNVTDFASRTVQ
jgi:hypothetical protein